MKGNRVGAQRRDRDMTSLPSLLPEEVVVHNPQDAVTVEDREPLHRLLLYVHIAADHIQENVGY